MATQKVIFTAHQRHICDRACENQSYLHIKFDLILSLSNLITLYPNLDPFVINYLYILECSKSLKPFSCLLRPFHVYKFTCVLIGLNNKQ